MLAREQPLMVEQDPALALGLVLAQLRELAREPPQVQQLLP